MTRLNFIKITKIDVLIQYIYIVRNVKLEFHVLCKPVLLSSTHGYVHSYYCTFMIMENYVTNLIQPNALVCIGSYVFILNSTYRNQIYKFTTPLGFTTICKKHNDCFLCLTCNMYVGYIGATLQ